MDRVRKALGTLLVPDRVLDLPPAEAKREAVRRLGRLACDAAGVNTAHGTAVLDALWDREMILSTGIGLGIAVPHVRHANVPHEAMVVGRARGGLAFDAIDGKPVHAVFTILMPAGDNRRHVEVLGAIAAALKDPARRESVFAAGDGAAFVRKMLGE
ncbi:MAG TPA: PTS sugar transporter subunit IIA [Planctomycetota bacterium]|nr:PTS sugar transporter subunit IIA [Planctomycetota bacterium]